jgi:FdrA protein
LEDLIELSKEKTEKKNILTEKLKVINIGIETFANDLNSQYVEVIHVDWKPPAGGDLEMLKILAKLGL